VPILERKALVVTLDDLLVVVVIDVNECRWIFVGGGRRSGDEGSGVDDSNAWQDDDVSSNERIVKGGLIIMFFGSLVLAGNAIEW